MTSRIEILLSFDHYILFGATSSVKNCIDFLNKRNKSIRYILDNDKKKEGNTLYGFEVKPPKNLDKEFSKNTLIIIASAYQLDIYNQLVDEFHIPKHNISPYIDEMMYNVYIGSSNISPQQKHRIHNLLQDLESKEYFNSLIKFRQTLDLEEIKLINHGEKQYIHYRMNYNKFKNSIIDIGAYDGDSLSVFSKYCPNIKEIFCIEPFLPNYINLLNNIKSNDNYKKAIPLQYAISNQDDIEVNFSNDMTPNSMAKIETIDNNRSDNLVLTKTIDSLFSSTKIDLIKMDIEGEELKALEGARNVISAQAPNLIISAYHSYEHIVDIVDMVSSFSDNYLLYCYHPPLAIYEIEYYFINKEYIK